MRTLTRRGLSGGCVFLACLLSALAAGAQAPTEPPATGGLPEWEPPGGPPCEPGSGLWLESVPFGAEVFEDGRLLGRTPLCVPREAAEEGRLVVQHPGCRRAVVRGIPDGKRFLEVRLEPLGRAEAGPGLAGRRTVRYGLLAVGAGAAVLGLECKDRADRAYDEYLRTGNLGKMRDAFDRAERYDGYALGCWAVAEVSVLSFLYLLTHSTSSNTWGLCSTPETDRGPGGIFVRWTF